MVAGFVLSGLIGMCRRYPATLLVYPIFNIRSRYKRPGAKITKKRKKTRGKHYGLHNYTIYRTAREKGGGSVASPRSR